MDISTKIQERQNELEAFLVQHFGTSEPVEPSPGKMNEGHRGGEIPDGELIQRIENSKQGDKFSELFSGDTTVYSSQSEADLALCNMLAFWTGKNPDQMDRIFCQSALMRPKWDEFRGDKTYGEMTIETAIRGCKEVYDYTPFTVGGVVVDPVKLLEQYVVTKEYVKRLGTQGFLFENLIIKQHVVTIIAESGGGKTTICFRHVAPNLAKQGMTVYYIDADSPASDHEEMVAIADMQGFKFLNPDVNQGTSIEGLLENFKVIADSGAALTDWVIFIDTLKKIADLLQKSSVKQLYILCRKLAAKGATIILLGHANKYRDNDGNLVFEGVGDVKSDSDELIFFERRPNQDGGIDVTTIVDTSKGAKVRGIFKPISFHISEAREIKLYDSPLRLPELTATGTVKATNDEILIAAQDFLAEWGEPITQGEFSKHIAEKTGASQKRVRSLITQNSAQKGVAGGGGTMFVYTRGDRKSFMYELQQWGVSPEDIDTCVDEPKP